MVAYDVYVTAYMGDESNANVHFDEVQVVLGRGPWVQENSKPKLRGS